jgi:hypothetical protein
MSRIDKNIRKKYGDNNPFTQPDGYFESFSDRLMSRIAEEHDSKQKQTGIIKYLKPALTMAASFAIIFFLIYVPVSIINSKNEVVQITAEQEEDTNFFDFYYLNSRSLYSMISTENKQNKQIDNEVIEDYLLASLSEYDLIQLSNSEIW